MAMAVAAASGSDADLAFQMQMNEALAASMGISSMEYDLGFGNKLEDERGQDAAMASYIQEMEVEALQKQALDKSLAAKVLTNLTEEAAKLVHDLDVARAIDEMPEDEWEKDGDLYERPFEANKQQEEVRVFFKGLPVSEGGIVVGAALGGAVLDFGGNQLVQLQRYVPAPTGKHVAQCLALVDVLKAAHSLGARKIIAYTDSKPLINQIKGYWRVTTKALRIEFFKAMELLRQFESYDLNLALHGENWPAESLARMASIAQRQTVASSSKAMLHCIICMEDIASENIYPLKECGHKFCSSCVKQHVESTVTSGVTFPVACPLPECGKKFTEDECKVFLSQKALEVFLKKIDESRIPETCRVYCPYPNCSDLMDKRAFLNQNLRRLCGACKREFCLNCRVPWHSFYSCLAYQRLAPELKDAEDAKLYRLAENQKWRQCKQCRRMIELAEGCYHMTCRCGYEFCYTCGAVYRNKLQTCTCKLWDEHNIIAEEDEEDFEDYEGEFEADDYESYGYDSEGEYDEIQPPQPPPPQPQPQMMYRTLCRHFERGHCRFGNTCRFAHGMHELR